MTTGKKRPSLTTRNIRPADSSRRQKRKPSWCVYILECSGGRLYTGMTNDLARRLRAHFLGKGARFTRSFGVTRLVYTERLPSRGKALRREAAIKRLPRKQKLTLIEKHPPERLEFLPCGC